MKWRACIGATTAAATLALPSNGVASMTFGSNVNQTANLALGVTNATTIVDTAVPTGGPSVTSPITGTIIRWRITTGSLTHSGTITFRVIAPVGAMFSGAGTGDTEAVPGPSTTTTFPTQLPIAAGDYIGVDLSAGGQLNAFVNAQIGADFGTISPPLADNGTPAALTSQTNKAFLINADVAALPTSSLNGPACSNSGQLAATVTADPDPAVTPKAIHFRVDGGSEQTSATSGSPGVATFSVPAGWRTLEYWAEDSVGGLESQHHMVTPDTTPPVVTITSDQGKMAYALNEPASISVAATGSGGSLQTDPSGIAEGLPTNVPGTFTIARTAVDRCGRSTTARFTYTVGTAAIRHLKTHPKSFSNGTTVTYTDSQAATTTFTVLRAVRRGSRTRYIQVAIFRHGDALGANRVSLKRRLNRHKLRPGQYRLKAIALGPLGKPGRPAVTTFRVVG